jgi:hypothetical protein
MSCLRLPVAAVPFTCLGSTGEPAGNGQPSTRRRKAKEPVGCGLRIAGGGEDRTRITLEDQPFPLWGQWQNSNEIPLGRNTPPSRGRYGRGLLTVLLFDFSQSLHVALWHKCELPTGSEFVCLLG